MGFVLHGNTVILHVRPVGAGEDEVEIRTGVHVKAIDEHGVMIGDERLEVENVIWTAGVKASPAGQWLRAEVARAGRVKVMRDLSP